MTLNDYVKMFTMVNEDTEIRLWTQCRHGYGMISKYDLSKPEKLDDKCTCKEFMENEHWLSNYKECLILGCNDSDVPEVFKDAVNIVIDLPDNYTIY